ncbi:sulfonate transport system ATP-binding protein [Marinobacter sp. MBR-99]|jgi:sulfonate transport system ATP-binding protein|uniref:ABC transporter ATP-binding protein n=1 Tax=Marinobacter sp. MBR-99 TaxID=3156461 RepID=UPI0033931190
MNLEPIVQLTVHNKRFGNSLVLDNVSFEIGSGEIVSLVGPSGCGKSTLLRIVAGLDTDFRGRIRFLHNGEEVDGNVGFVFQEPRLLPWLTVAQNVGFGSDHPEADRPRILALLEEVGLGDAADKLPKELSGGMAQRAAIARGLFAPAPGGNAGAEQGSAQRILLLDEPFSAVDAFTRIKLQDLLIHLARVHHLTLLVVTHDVDEAAYLSDRVLVLGSNPGRILHANHVALARPRDRRDPALTQVRNDLLEVLSQSHAI